MVKLCHKAHMGTEHGKKAFVAGDWVRLTPLWPGIWKVYRVLADFKEDECFLHAPLRQSEPVLLFCHRLVNDSWKRSFAHHICERSHASQIATEDNNRIHRLLSLDGKLRKAFEQYGAKQARIDLVVNIGLGGFAKKEIADFGERCRRILAARIQAGLTIREVLQLLAEHGMEENRHELPRQMTLQLVCINHELRGDEFVHKEYRVLPD